MWKEEKEKEVVRKTQVRSSFNNGQKMADEDDKMLAIYDVAHGYKYLINIGLTDVININKYNIYYLSKY